MRHNYAVHCLENGESIRDLQQALGHEHIKTTLQYTRCILPTDLESPLDPLKRNQREGRPQTVTDKKSSVSGLQSSVFPAPDPFHISVFPAISPAALELPFAEPAADPSSRFYQLIKTLITGRFLSSRRRGTRSG